MILEGGGVEDPNEVLERTRGLQWSIFARRFQISVAESGVCEASVMVRRFFPGIHFHSVATNHYLRWAEIYNPGPTMWAESYAQNNWPKYCISSWADGLSGPKNYFLSYYYKIFTNVYNLIFQVKL